MESTKELAARVQASLKELSTMLSRSTNTKALLFLKSLKEELDEVLDTRLDSDPPQDLDVLVATIERLESVVEAARTIIANCESTIESLEASVAELSVRYRVEAVARRAAEASLSTSIERVAELEAALEAALASCEPGAGDPGTGDPGTGDPGTGDPGTGDPGTGTGTGDPSAYWALQHVNKTTEEIKELRPPGWDERRAALEARVRSSEYKAFNQGGGDVNLLNLDMVGPDYHYIQKCVSVNWGDTSQQGLNFRASNLTFKSASLENATGLKWFMRLYNLHNVVFEDIIADGQTYNNKQTPDEHGWYFNCSGDSLQQWCLVRNFGGKPFYFAHREFPYPGYSRGDNAPYTRKTTHVIDSCVSIDNDQDAAKGSYAASFFDCGSLAFPAKIHIKNSVFASKWDYVRNVQNNTRLPGSALDSSPENIQSCGAIMVSSYQQMGSTYPVEEVLIENTVFSHFGNKKHPLIVIRNAEVVHLKGCVLNSHSGTNVIDIGSDGRWMGGQLFPKKLILEDCDSATDTTFRFWNTNGTFTAASVISLGNVVEFVRPQLA